MPLVHIHLAEGTSQQHRRAIGDVIYEAMRATIDVPQDDRFQLFHEYATGTFRVNPTYLDRDEASALPDHRGRLA
jgi:4-oxalocrotonate tautomerase